MARTERTLNAQIDLIAKALNAQKAKSIRRIVRRLEGMAPKDVQFFERLMVKR